MSQFENEDGELLMTVGKKYESSFGVCDRCDNQSEYTVTLHHCGGAEVPVCRNHAKAILPEIGL